MWPNPFLASFCGLILSHPSQSNVYFRDKMDGPIHCLSNFNYIIKLFNSFIFALISNANSHIFGFFIVIPSFFCRSLHPFRQGHSSLDCCGQHPSRGSLVRIVGFIFVPLVLPSFLLLNHFIFASSKANRFGPSCCSPSHLGFALLLPHWMMASSNPGGGEGGLKGISPYSAAITRPGRCPPFGEKVWGKEGPTAIQCFHPGFSQPKCTRFAYSPHICAQSTHIPFPLFPPPPPFTLMWLNGHRRLAGRRVDDQPMIRGNRFSRKTMEQSD